MTIEVEECWLRWRRGEAIEVLAKEYGVTRERMRYRLKKMDLTHPSRLRDVVLEEAAKVVDELYPENDWTAQITPPHYDRRVNGIRQASAAIRAMKGKP